MEEQRSTKFVLETTLFHNVYNI